MPEPEIICVGMTVVDVLAPGFEGMPARGETGTVSDISLAPGGDATNQAVALAKLGNRVGLWGVVGDDAQGQFLQKHYAEMGINADGVTIDPQRKTATGLVLISPDGERSFVVKRKNTHHEYGPKHIDLDRIRPGTKVVSVGSLFCAEPFDLHSFAPLMCKAKAAGAITIADMVMDQRGYGLDGLAEAWPFLDYAAPSQLEGELFTGEKEPAAIAAAFQRRGVKNVIVKRGELGVMLFGANNVYECPAFKVPVIDTTGAGDNFTAGFIHALLQGLEPQAALRFGSAVAALSIQAIGAGAGLRDLQQVKAFLADHTEVQ